LRTKDGYRKFQELVAHEFFHLWNVKRIRPDPWGRSTTPKENYTRLLLVAEGFNPEYYGQLMVRRAGLISDQAYLDHWHDRFRISRRQPGRSHERRRSEFRFVDKILPAGREFGELADLLLRQGWLLGLLLDLDIRRRTNNAKSLDDVMRYLYTEFLRRPELHARGFSKSVRAYVRGES